MKKLIHIFTMIAMGTLPVWLSGCGGGDGHAGHGAHGDEAVLTEVTLSAAAMRQHKISLGSVKPRTLRPTFSVPARVVFDAETVAHVGTLVNGRVSDMNARLGDTVKKGDVLFTIESPELGAAQNAFLKALDAEAAAGPAVALAQNNAGVAQATAEGKAAEAMLALANNPATVALAQGKLDAAKPVLQRATELFASGKKLAAEGALAVTELKRRETAVQTATADVQSAEAALAQAKAQQTRDIAAAQANVAAAIAGLKAAEAQQAKALGEAKSALNTAQATVAAERNRLTLFGMAADAMDALAKDRALTPHYIVRAPRAGTVVEREVTLGEIANPSRPHLLVLADLSKVWVLIEVPPARAEGLKAGQSVTLVNKDTDYRTAATLAFISPLVDPETRTVQARVELENPDGQWRPGQFLTVQLPTGAAPKETLVVPASAVQMVDGQPTVYMLTKKQNTFKARAIAVGQPVGEWLPVIKGLAANEQVVTKGSFLLKAEFGKAGAGQDHSH
ncbi:MAG: efflux RND transporter periplasmic adaptor subunit [Verrucomicrobiota bacterium]|nr:efflux RND transporter periplasmic adaptor subunit [Verrucomicrobiota bacterium]